MEKMLPDINIIYREKNDFTTDMYKYIVAISNYFVSTSKYKTYIEYRIGIKVEFADTSKKIINEILDIKF